MHGVFAAANGGCTVLLIGISYQCDELLRIVPSVTTAIPEALGHDQQVQSRTTGAVSRHGGARGLERRTCRIAIPGILLDGIAETL